MCMSERKIMKTVIALEKKHVFHHENNFTYQKGALTGMNIEPSLCVCSIAHCI